MKLDILEKSLLGILLISSILGLYWGFAEQEFFTTRYMMEDGEIEYGTVLLLLASCWLVMSRWIRLRKDKPFNFTLISIVIFLAFFFVAGEELSWGQRIFNIESSEYFKENNAQEELNLHNLTVGDVKINKLVFGLLLTTAILVYMILFPILYHKVKRARDLIDHWFIPIPRRYQILAYLFVLVAISIIPASKNWELLEFGSVLVFFLILWSPVNLQLFEANNASGNQ